MRFYTEQHEHYCGIDLHKRTMYLCVVDATGEGVLERNVKSRPEQLLRALDRFRGDVVVGAERAMSRVVLNFHGGFSG